MKKVQNDILFTTLMVDFNSQTDKETQRVLDNFTYKRKLGKDRHLKKNEIQGNSNI